MLQVQVLPGSPNFFEGLHGYERVSEGAIKKNGLDANTLYSIITDLLIIIAK